jgi:hypothetical protein
MYLRTGESFVTEEVLSMPYTASSSGCLSNHVKRSLWEVWKHSSESPLYCPPDMSCIVIFPFRAQARFL